MKSSPVLYCWKQNLPEYYTSQEYKCVAGKYWCDCWSLKAEFTCISEFTSCWNCRTRRKVFSIHWHLETWTKTLRMAAWNNLFGKQVFLILCDVITVVLSLCHCYLGLNAIWWIWTKILFLGCSYSPAYDNMAAKQYTKCFISHSSYERFFIISIGFPSDLITLNGKTWVCLD